MNLKDIGIIILILILGIFILSFFAGVNEPESDSTPQASPEATGGLAPARDLSGDWSGSASFQENVEGAECLFNGKFALSLQQEGNDVAGDFSFTETSLKQKRVQTDSGVPAVGCAHPVEGVTSGQTYGKVSSSSVALSVGGRRQFSGSFTSDLLSLKLEKCLVQDEPCAVADAAKWKISLTRR